MSASTRNVFSETPGCFRPRSTGLNACLSAIGALFGIAGTGLLAALPDQVALVFVLYVISNLAWVAVAIRTRQPWLLLMNVVYLSIGVLGLSHHL